MKLLITHLALLIGLTLSTSAVIAPNTGCTSRVSTGTTITCTFSPTAGNRTMVFFDSGAAITGATVTCADNNSNALTAGPTQVTGASVNAKEFDAIAITGATSYTCSWTGGTSTAASMTAEDYSGSLGINRALSGNTATGTSGTASVSVTTEDANNWVICGIAGIANTFTVTVGNQRQNQSTTSQKQVLLDNTSVLAGSVTCTATSTSQAWTAIAIELRTVSGSGSKCAACDLSWNSWGQFVPEEWAGF